MSLLNLVAVVAPGAREGTARRLDRARRVDRARTILCVVEPERRTIAPATGGDERGLELEVGPAHLAQLGGIVAPLVDADVPTILWCPAPHAAAIEALRDVVDVALLDSDDPPGGPAGLARSAATARSAYVVDLAWLRTTPWRERLAASFDPPDRLASLGSVTGVSIVHRRDTPATALLLGGWLASRLGWDGGRRAVDVSVAPSEDPGRGLSAVTVACADGFELSLGAARGGLSIRERSPSGQEHTSLVLGAEGDEDDALGEGVRQALLRDPTYAPALDAALRLPTAFRWTHRSRTGSILDA